MCLLIDSDDGIYRQPSGTSGNILKNSTSFDSFTPNPYHDPYPTTTTTVEMHQVCGFPYNSYT